MTRVRRIGALAAIALGVLAAATGSAEAANSSIKGRFTCNDGQPLANVRVELMHTFSRLLPEVWPNQRVSVATRSGPNGEFAFRVTGGETNWRVRAVLVNNDVGVKDFPMPFHHYHDTLRTQNKSAVIDYGTQVVPGAECRLWRAFKSAADGYRADTGTSSPSGTITVFDNAITSGVPFTPYTDVFWPGGYAPVPTAQHEFAHSFRHQLDGNKAHFLLDSGKFWYLRSHSSTSCASTNHGFAFNEGWAEYWASEVSGNRCPNAQDFSIERNVALELGRLQTACRLTRGRMVQVLVQNRGRIHSMSDFSNALGCVPPTPKPIKSTGKAKRPASAVSASVALRLVAGKSLLFDLARDIAKARSTLSKTSGFAERALLRARLKQAQSLRSTLSFLRSRTEQRRIARLSDKKQLDLIAAKQREHLRKMRSISADALRYIADRLRRNGNREGAKVMKRAGAGAAAGRLDVLQVTGLPLGTPQAGGGNLPTTGAQGAPTPGPAPLPVPIGPKADLVVPLVVSLSYDPGFGTCTVRYRRANVGAVAAGASTTSVQLAAPNQVTVTYTNPALPLNLTPSEGTQESIVIPGINCDPDVYQITATVTADSANAVDESNEANNSLSRLFGPPIP